MIREKEREDKKVLSRWLEKKREERRREEKRREEKRRETKVKK